ncbi:MAG: SLC13 family permease [Desulfovibrio sp.]|uniref:SLC13 family permease n=1 Tax=Desulfovibrio sp. 7SRBS1 TaxID=3378064 RepID=UPI003B41EB4A
MQRGKLIKWVINLLFPVAIYFLGPTFGIPPKLTLFFTITSWGVLSWVLDTLPDTLVAILMPAIYVVTKLGTGKQIFAPWGTTIPWIVVGGMMMGMIMMQTGLAKRIALFSIRVAGFSFTKVMAGLMLAGYIISPFVPSVMGKAAIISVVSLGICEALHLKKGSREGATVLMVGFVSVACAKLAYLTGGGDIVMAMNIAGKGAGSIVTWSEYFVHNFPIAVVYGIISLACILLIMRPKLDADLEGYIHQEYAALGKVSPNELKSMAILVSLLLLMATSKWHGINSGYVLLFMGGVCFLPGVDLLNKEKLNKMNFSVIFFVIGSMCIGSAAKVAGASGWVEQLVAPYLDGSLSTALMGIFGVGLVSNLFLTPLAAVAALTGPITTICQHLGVSPAVGSYSLLYGLDQYFFPYEYAVLLYFYAYGYMKMKQVAAVFGVRAVVTALYLLFVAVPYWKFIGA